MVQVEELMHMSRNVLVLRGLWGSNQSSSNVMVFDQKERLVFSCKGLERAWKDNMPMISCIPQGVYDLRFEYSPTFKMYLYELYGVPGRTECKFHASNFARQVNGCIALGDMFMDIDGDGAKDVRNSRKTMRRFHKAMAGVKVAQVRVVNY